MPGRESAELRLEILKTLKLGHSSKQAKFFAFKVKTILNALRPSGFSDLSRNQLWAEIVYLRDKGFVQIEKEKNFLTGEDFDCVSITVKGIDLVEKAISEIGIASDE
jgi:hypothetical protein